MTRYMVSCLEPFAPEVVEIVKAVTPENFDVRFASSFDPAEQLELARVADFIMLGGGPLTGAMIEQAKNLKLIQKWGIGVDKVDLDTARRLGIPVTITGAANAGPVAELAIALMLAVYRRIPYADRKTRAGTWIKAEMRANCFQLGGKTIGLLGFGAIARMVAHRLRGFDARIVYYDINRADYITERGFGVSYLPFAELLAASDVLSVHTPLTPKTRYMIDGAAIASMKTGAIIVNTARGGIIDEKALYDALVSGKLRGAGLDSFEQEPLQKGHPLAELDRVIMTPHAGGGVFDNVEHVTRHAYNNMLKLLNGEDFAPIDVILPGTARKP